MALMTKRFKTLALISLSLFFVASLTSQTESAKPDATAGTTSTATAKPVPQRVRVSQQVSQGLLQSSFTPLYPAEAKRKHIQGKVVLHAIVGKDGYVLDLKPISGPDELIPAAIAAVQQWKFRPFKLNDVPIEVDTQVTVDFKLN